MLAIPVVLLSLPIGGGQGFTLVQGASGLGDWNKGLYFFRVESRIATGSGFLQISTEISINILVITNVVTFTPPATPAAGVIGYRVFIGTVSGSYTNFADVSATVATNFIDQTGATFPGTGGPTSGTGALTRLMCYDMVLKAWAVIDLPFSISVLKQVRAIGTEPITVSGGFSDGSVRRLQANDTTFDGTAVSWSVQTPEVFGKLANSRTYYRRLTIRGTTTQASLAINAVINLDGTPGASNPVTVYTIGNVLGTFDFLAQVDIGFTNFTSHITLSGTGNVEVTSFDWEAAPLREGLPPVI